MPRIRFIDLTCGCGSVYHVRVDRLEEGGGFECVSCGAMVDVGRYAGLVALLHRYSEAVLEIEQVCEVDGDTVRPAQPVPARSRGLRADEVRTGA